MAIKLTTYYAGNPLPEMPGNDTFHSNSLFHVYAATPDYTPILLTASEDGRILGKMLVVMQDNKKFFNLFNYRLCQVLGTGEYFDNTRRDEVFALMLNYLTEEILNYCHVVEFRNLKEALFGYKSFKENQYFAVNWLKVRYSLHSITHVEERFSPSRLRQVKKGLNNGAIVRLAESREEVEQFTEMLQRVYSSKIRRHFPNRQFFQHLQETLGSEGNVRIFIVFYKGKIIGGSVCVYSSDNAYMWFSGGMTKKYLRQYPGVLAVWKAMADAKERGYNHIEFLDVGLPFRKHGYREFVLRFGGKQISTRRWFHFRWNLLNRVLMRIYS